MVLLNKDDLFNTYPLLSPSGWYPGTSPLHSLIEEKEWELVSWRLLGVDWDELRSICQDIADTRVVPLDNLFKRITCGDGFSVSPNITNYCIPPIPELFFPRSTDGKLPLHVAVDVNAPIPTLKLLLGPHCSLIRSYSRLHGLPLYYACHSLSSNTSLGQRLLIIDLLIQRYPHAAFVKSPNGDYPLHALMRNCPNAELIGLFLSMERDGSGRTSPVLGLLSDADGQLPLHIGLDFDAPEEAIRALLSLYPASAGHRRDLDGKTPANLVNPSIISDSLLGELLRLEESFPTTTTYR